MQIRGTKTKPEKQDISKREASFNGQASPRSDETAPGDSCGYALWAAAPAAEGCGAAVREHRWEGRGERGFLCKHGSVLSRRSESAAQVSPQRKFHCVRTMLAGARRSEIGLSINEMDQKIPLVLKFGIQWSQLSPKPRCQLSYASPNAGCRETGRETAPDDRQQVRCRVS